MQSVFGFLMVGLLSAVAGIMVPTALQGLEISLFGFEMRAAPVVLSIAVLGVLFGAAMAIVTIVCGVRDRALTRRNDTAES